MGKTLFWYLFRDLVRIFFLSSIVIAGIMSFGGLLRPLTVLGLDAWRVGQMWLYLMPAMMTYSMPIAAVFASSMVYGRLSADNELTACRAAGMSYTSVAAPGLVLGMVAGITSLVFLSYVVPFFFLQAEKVASANVARVIAADIERKHSFIIQRGKPVLFAQSAYIPPDRGNDNEQILVLTRPAIIDFTKEAGTGISVPKSFALAEEATLFIRQIEDEQIEISGVLKWPTYFSRTLGARPHAGGENVPFAPIRRPSLLKQQVKFMNVSRLKELQANPELTTRVKEQLANFILLDQRNLLFNQVTKSISEGAPEGITFTTGSAARSGETYQLIAPGARWTYPDNALQLQAGNTPMQVIRTQPNGRVRKYLASAIRLTPEMDNFEDRVDITLDMKNVTLMDTPEPLQKTSDPQVFSIPMPPELKKMQSRRTSDYLVGNWREDKDRVRLMNRIIVATSEVTAEIHSRASFGVSCLVLVMVGTALGMLLRSGDFLSAFAVSVIPALITITLVVAGSQTATEVSAALVSRLPIGLLLIWSGNVLALILACWLFHRLRRT